VVPFASAKIDQTKPQIFVYMSHTHTKVKQIVQKVKDRTPHTFVDAVAGLTVVFNCGALSCGL
jgi:hypothetical protein